MNRLDFGSEEDVWSHNPPEISQRGQAAISTLAFLLIAYYGWPYLAYETTIKRTIYEYSNALIPTKFVQTLRQSARRIVSLPELGNSDNGVASERNLSALNQLYEGSGVSSVIKRARTLSGLETLAPKVAETIYPGLGNWDNSCFQNSVLQGLASLDTFKTFIDKSYVMFRTIESEASTHGALSTFLTQLQENVSRRSTLWPPSVLRSMNTWQQQDAQEYFSKIMDAIEKEAIKYVHLAARRVAPGLDCIRPRVNNSADSNYSMDENDNNLSKYSILTSMLPPNPLDGSLSQSLRCQKCGFSEGLSLIPFNCLTLNLGLGGNCYLEDLFDAYTDPEMIEGVECDECTRLASEEADSKAKHLEGDLVALQPPKNEPSNDGQKPSQPKVLSTKAKQILFGRLPPNLVIHINRSIFDQLGNQKKNVSHVSFPAMLDIGEGWMENPLADQDVQIHASYELRCIVTHQGRHDNGHYVACGKRGKEWFSFNDETVTKISEEQVLARGHVFMLFYEMIERRPILEIPAPQDTPVEVEIEASDRRSRHGPAEQESNIPKPSVNLTEDATPK